MRVASKVIRQHLFLPYLIILEIKKSYDTNISLVSKIRDKMAKC